jgi:hypothetical protein
VAGILFLLLIVYQRIEAMNPEKETRKQAFERMRKEYRSTMTNPEVIEVFDNVPDWLPDHLLAKLPPERLEFMSTETTVNPLAPQSETNTPLQELLHFLAYLSMNYAGFAGALCQVYVPQDKPKLGTFNRHRMARFLMLHAHLEQVVFEHELPPILLAKLIQCGHANTHSIDKTKEVDLKTELINEPFSSIVEVITTYFANTKTLDRVFPLLSGAKAEELAARENRFKTFYIQKYAEIGSLYEPGAPAQDKWFEALETRCEFSLTAEEHLAYTKGQVRALGFTFPLDFGNSPEQVSILTLQKRIAQWCSLPQAKPEQPQAKPKQPEPQTPQEPYTDLEKKLYPESKQPTNTNPPTSNQTETKAEEKPGFWKRIWNWLGKNWDKLLLGILIIGSLLWLIWKQYFAPKKAKTSYGEQDQPAARKKRSGYNAKDFSMG